MKKSTVLLLLVLLTQPLAAGEQGKEEPQNRPAGSRRSWTSQNRFSSTAPAGCRSISGVQRTPVSWTATPRSCSPASLTGVYNMLLVATNAGRNTPASIPIISFVHWHTTAPPEKPDPSVKQLSRESYQELLWHMLLRGTDTFFLWCPRDEDSEQTRLVHEVYAAAQQYGEFLEKGTPVDFRVPTRPGPAVFLGIACVQARTPRFADASATDTK